MVFFIKKSSKIQLFIFSFNSIKFYKLFFINVLKLYIVNKKSSIYFFH
jgi:hypothetical protein